MSSDLEIRDTGISVTDVLELISRGFTYERILFTLEGLTYEDILDAARKAKELIEGLSTFREHDAATIRQRYPRAYEGWTAIEETVLQLAYDKGKGLTIRELAEMLERQPGAIHSRLRRLRLIE